jgi:hypothetical protein
MTSRCTQHGSLDVRQRAGLLITLTVMLSACAFIDDDRNLTIVEQQPVSGRVGDRSLPPAGPVRHLRDPFDYRLASNREYLMLLAPAVETHQDSELGQGRYSVMYLHDPASDLPAGRFPDSKISPDQSPVASGRLGTSSRTTGREQQSPDAPSG